MKHFILTRSAYPPSYPVAANRRRLELLRHVTMPSLAAQTERRWAWILMVDPRDPLLTERLAVAGGAGVEVIPATVGQGPWTPPAPTTPDGRLAGDVAGPWHRVVAAAAGSEPRVATTRIDDDDALSVDALHRVRAAMDAAQPGLTAWMLPVGLRYHRGRVQPMRHLANMFSTLESPGDPLHVVMEVKHNDITSLAPVRYVDNQPGWLWVRHEDARSGSRQASGPVTATVRRTLAIDWDWLARLGQVDVHEWARRERDMAPHVETLIGYARKARTIIELGVRAGASTWAFLDGLPAEGRLWSVDIAQHRVPARVSGDPRWSFIRGDDGDPSVRKRLPDQADLVFIDTSHELEHTKAELEFALSRRPSRIACHDAEWPGVAAAVEWFRTQAGWQIARYTPAGDDRGPFGLVVLEP